MQISGTDVQDLRFETIGSWPWGLRLLVVLIFMAGVIYLGYMYDWSSYLDDYAKLQAQEITLKKNFVDLQKQIANKDAFNHQISEVRGLLNTLTQQLPKSPEEAGLLDDISAQATAANVTIKAIKPQPEIQNAFYGVNTFEITIVGYYHNIGKFVAGVSNIPRIVTLHDFTLKAETTSPQIAQTTGGGANAPPGMAGGEIGSAPLEFVVVVKTYWYIPAETSNAPAKNKPKANTVGTTGITR